MDAAPRLGEKWAADVVGARNEHGRGRSMGWTDRVSLLRVVDEELGEAAGGLFEWAAQGRLRLTGPPKAFFEEKLLLALCAIHTCIPLATGVGRRAWGRSRSADSLCLGARSGTTCRLHGVYPKLEVWDWASLEDSPRNNADLSLK